MATHESIWTAAISLRIDAGLSQLSTGHVHRIRVGKIIEELGEVEQLLIELEGSNPRKVSGRDSDTIKDDIRRELLDVALAALCAFEHFSGNVGASLPWLLGHINRVHARLQEVPDGNA